MTVQPSLPVVTPYLRRIAVILAVLVALTWAGGIFAITQLGRVQEKSRDINEQALQSTLVLGQMATDLNAFRIREARLTRGAAGEDRQKGRAELLSLEGQMAANSRRFESLDASNEEMRLFMKFLADWRNYANRARAMAETPPPAASASDALLTSKALFENAGVVLAQLIRINVEQGRTALEEAEAIYRSSMSFIIAALVLSTMIITGMLLLIIWHESK